MSRRGVLFVKGAVLLAALLLTAPQVLGGEHVRAADQRAARPQPAPAPVTRLVATPVTIALTAVAPTQAPTESAYISLRGPDGQLRRFAVEGGPDAVSSRVIVLRPGDSLTIQLAAKK
jgi:hypothetical protein